MFARMLVVFFLVLIAGVWGLIQVSRLFFAYTSDAYVLSDYVVLSPTVAGRLDKVFVVDNQVVAAGDGLFEIDRQPFALAVDSAQAAVTLAEAAQKAAEDALAGSTAELKASQATLDDTQGTQERIATLFQRGTVSQQRLDDATRDLNAATAGVAAAQSALVVAQDLVEQRKAALAAASADLGVAQYNLGQSRTVSPYDGFVVPFTVRAGTYLDVGDPVLSVVDNEAWRIVANLPEEHLAYVEVGEPVWFMVSSRPWQIFDGRVRSISRGISRTPTPVDPLPYVEPTTEWIRLSRRFPVEIAIENDPDLPLFMGADARVLIWHPRGGGEPTETGQPEPVRMPPPEAPTPDTPAEASPAEAPQAAAPPAEAPEAAAPAPAPSSAAAPAR